VRKPTGAARCTAARSDAAAPDTEECGMAQGTVKSWLHRGRLKLAATLTAQEEGSIHADHG